MRRVKTSSDQNQKTLPIKDVRQQNNMLYYWLNKRDTAQSKNKKYLADRNYMFLFVSLNTAFRCEDVLQLRPMDLDGGYVRIKENKTGKTQNFRLNPRVYSEIQDYVERNEIANYDYMFQSQRKDGVIQCITRQQALNIVHETGKAIGIKYKFGVHSLRKTFGYNYIKKGGNLLNLMKMYNHSSPATTLLYVMWSNDDIEQEREKIFNGVTGKKQSKKGQKTEK